MQTSLGHYAGICSPILRGGPPAADEAVVCVHGNPGSSRDWVDLLTHVVPFCRALAPDMPGFGQADKPADFDHTVAGYARHLGVILDAEGVQRVHLVLHDFGGAWGLAWAAQHTERVASVSLINVGVMPGYRWHYMARIWRTPLLGELFMATNSRTASRLALKHGNPRGLPAAYFDEMYANFDKGTKRAVLKLYRNTDDLGAETELAGARLAPHRIPAQVLWGERDPYVPAGFAQLQRKYFDVRQLTLLPDSGHWPMIDNPAAARAALLPFLQAQLHRAAA
ncbi:MAG TPA: alpha/beta fold hydrolase [Albitalea sp.]|nr:alpha/beta fold hydrolase [Albitalea sp.]